MTPTIFILLVIGAFICEFIDASLGMCYGTILGPVLIAMGYDPLVVIPSILITQAAGGAIASIFHNKFGNSDLSVKKENKDLKIVAVITGFGVFATVLAAVVAMQIPKEYLKTYIGILVLIMGIILVTKAKFKFSWKRMIGVSLLSAFNKGLSGGGFGPVVTSGQVISGNGHKSSIGNTTAAEAPICIAGFLTYIFTKGLTDWSLIGPLLIGSILAAPLGAYFTKKVNPKILKPVIGILVIILGIWTLAKTWF